MNRPPIQVSIINKSDSSIILTGQQLLDNDFNDSLIITPTNSDYTSIEDMGLLDGEIDLARFQSKNEVLKDVETVGKSGWMYPMSQFEPKGGAYQKGIRDIVFSNIESCPEFDGEMMLSDFEMKLAPKAEITLTLFHIEKTNIK